MARKRTPKTPEQKTNAEQARAAAEAVIADAAANPGAYAAAIENRPEPVVPVAPTEFPPPIPAIDESDEDQVKEQYAKGGRRQNFTSYRDSEFGIRIEREFDRRPGQNEPRVLIRFRERPPAEVLEIVKAEGWEFQKDVAAWGKPGSAANLLQAQRTVNEVLKQLGADARVRT